MATKLHKQLSRELTRNPKKAAMLGLLALVACYFWAPLMLDWFGVGSEEPTQPASPTVVAQATPAPSSQPVALAPRAPRKSWEQLLHLMNDDPRMMSRVALALPRDPFASLKKAASATLADPLPVATVSDDDDTPEELGLQLTGTILGPKRRVALIGGRPYSVGQRIVVSDGVVFVVESVSGSQVVLLRGGRRHVLARASVSSEPVIQILSSRESQEKP